MNVQTTLEAFDRIALAPEDFPREAKIRVRTFHWEHGEMDFIARAIGPSSQSHLRIRADDGNIFAVPAADCDLIVEGL